METRYFTTPETTLPPVILEIGEAYIKCGFAGEPTPRRIYRSPLRDWKAQTKSGHRRTTDEWKEFAANLMTHIFLRVLRIKSDRRVLLVEDYLAPQGLRRAIAFALFDFLGIKGLLVQPNHLLALYPSGCSVGLVVDVGFRSSRVYPVVSSFHVERAFGCVPTSYSTVAANLAESLTKGGFMPGMRGSEHVLEDILAKFGRVREVGADAIKGDNTEIVMPAHGQITKFFPRQVHAACETLFEDTEEGDSLPQVVLESLIRCPTDLRRLVVQHVVVIGGGANIRGLAERLVGEIQARVGKAPASSRYAELKGVVAKMKLGATPYGPQITAYMGGVILSQTPAFDANLLKPAAYKQYGMRDQDSLWIPDQEETKTPVLENIPAEALQEPTVTPQTPRGTPSAETPLSTPRTSFSTPRVPYPEAN